MSIGLGFLFGVIDEHLSPGFLDKFGLTEDDFLGDELEVLHIIKHHAQLYGSVPQFNTVIAEWGDTPPPLAKQPLTYWSTLILERSASNQIEDSIRLINGSLEANNVTGAKDVVKKLYATLSTRHFGTTAEDSVDVGKRVLEYYRKQKVAEKEVRLPFGIPYIDKVSGGIHPGDFIVVVGMRGVGKTYLMLSMLEAAYLSGKNVLLVATEMTSEQYMMRSMSLRNQIPHDNIRKGKLGLHSEQTLEDDLTNAKVRDNKFHILKSSLSTTFEDLIPVIKDKRPDCVYIDGAYLIGSSATKRMSRYEQYSHGADLIKLTAQETNIPIIATYQLRRKTAGGLDDIYMTDVIAQNATIVMGIKFYEQKGVEDEKGNKKFRILELMKGREGEEGKLLMAYDLERVLIREVEVMDINDQAGNRPIPKTD